MKLRNKRIISLLLALVMLCGMMPMTVFAAEETEANPWSGRSAVFVGDSITAGTGTTQIYYQYLEESLGLGSVTSMGVGGSCISTASDYGTSNQPLINRYQNIPSTDLIIIFMGTNDYGHETPLGTVEDTEDGTFYGSLNTIIPDLVAKHPSSKIVFVTPLHRYGFGTSKILETAFTYDSIPNGVGASLGDYVYALKTVCANNGVSVIDLYTECTLDPSSAEVRAAYMPDGLHPNAAGHEVIAGIMESHIRGYEPVEGEPIVQTELIHGNKFAAGNNQSCRASSRINYYLKAGTVITLKNADVMQWACTKTSDENSSSNLGYFPDSGWSDKETAVVAEDGWIGFTFKYRDETLSFDLTKPLSDYITIEEPHVHSYTSTVTAPTCTEQGYTTYTCECGDSYVDGYVDATGHSYENGICTVCGDSFTGKKVSILSHSMSTYAGVSNNTAANSTIGSNDVYYTEGRLGVYQKDTWWQQVIDALDMELLVNNSWSGSCVFMPRKGEASVGYGDRAVNLHNDYTGEEPDIIFVYLGCNDFAYYKDTFGEAADVNYAALITDNGDGTFTYAAPATTCEAYAIMLHKVANRYPDAEIYCMTSTARRETDYTGDSYPDAGQPTLYSAQLQKIAKYFGYPVIDLENAIPKDVEIFDKYIGDKRAHANALGMDQISNEVLSVMLGTEVEICHVTSEDGIVAEQALLLGGSYSADVTLRPGYSIKVTMDGKDITSEAYQNGKITITKVTGDICVRAYIVHTPKDYLWNLENGELVSTGEYENNATKLSGTVTDGLLSNSCYAFATAIVLQHDLPWVLEWKIAGNWGGMLLSSTHTEKTANIQYITRTKGGQVCFGTWLEEKHRNYGVDLSALDNNAHVYRLENHIAADGSNMIWIYVDGTEIGPMNNYYIGSAYQSTDSAWVSGRDFVFSHVGTGGYPLNNCALDYMRVIECNHTYENGICTVCGAEHPNLANYEGKVISILGDSISTFAGYIPTADGFNLEHYARYPQDNLFTEVEHTWWMQVLTALDAKLGINESWRSTEVYNYIDAEVNSSYDGTKACMASVTRIQNLGSNGTPDVILFFGGTNDITQSRPVGTFDPFTAPTEVDLTSVKWDAVADAYVDAIMRMQYYYPDAQIIAMLPFDRNSQGTDKVEQYNSLFISICEHYGVPYVDLRECGISNADLPDGTHPDATGMDYITAAVMDVLLSDCDVEAGEHIVHSVTHNLNGAESSLGYYKGITHGKSFVTTITGENVTVSVTMGGADITDTAYANGVVTIAAVTGDIVITAQGRVKPIYEDHLQQLPENLCCSTNLWSSLVPENTYYTGSAWRNVSGNSVYSITIPVAAGDQIWATSFQKSGTNGGSRNGIRLTWFDESGVLESVSPDNVYTEFSANGYLTAPEGVVAVNVVMWNGNESNEVYILNHGHIYENGICTGCGKIVVDGIWQIMEDGVVIGAYSDLQCAVDACKDDSTIVLTEGYAATTGASIDKNITIDGDNHLVDISGCSDTFITVVEGAEVTVRDLRMDSGANGFAVDYDAVTYTDYTIPLVSGSLDSDPKVSKSAIISSGSLICENVEISNRYTASVGGAMQILAGTATLTNCDFTHNYGTSKGGALFIGSNFGTRTEYPVELVTITGCTFTENYTGHGGAIYAYNVAAIEITDSEFLNNTANGGKGGAIDLFSETTKPTTAMSLGLDFIQTSICNCTFRGNWAGNDGFAIQSYDSDLYIYDSEFIENVGVHPTSSVGTVSIEAYRHADENYRIYTRMDGCLFESNQGPCAVYGDHSSISDLDVTDCVFQHNKGNTSFLLYSATSRISNCQFIGEVMVNGVIDARIYENYTIPPLLTLADITFTGCDTPAEILTRKQGHNVELNTYRVILEGTTNGNITIWDSNTVTVNGTHTGNVQLGYGSERACLTVGSSGTVNGIIFAQPVDSKAKLGERYMAEVKAEGEGLTYQWYFRNAGSSKWNKSSVKDNTYDDVMTTARAGREVYCVITDANGNSVTTDIVKLICLPSVALEIVTQPVNDEAVLGEDFCVTVEAKGDGLKYQWYFRNAGSDKWYKSSVKDNTYDDVMTKARAGREIYCVITDAYGNSVTTETVKLICIPTELEIISQPMSAEVSFGEMFCATVEAKGDGLKYQWYFRNSGTDKWYKSGVRDNTYDDVMTKARNHREIYCVITDMWGNSVTTDTVKLTAVPSVELKVLRQSYESAVMGERYCVTVEAQGDGLNYQWYFRNAGASRWSKSGVRDNTYDDVMNKTRANREVYCVISDACGNQITTEVITLTVEQ